MMSEISDSSSTEPKLYLTKVLGGKVFHKNVSLQTEEGLKILSSHGYALFGKGERITLLKKKVSLECPECGCTQTQFEKTGRFGCSYCYTTFRFFIPGLLGKMHSGTSHFGKIPSKFRSPGLMQERMGRLREEMDRAVQKENYEEASRIRDEIQSIDKQLRSTPCGSDSLRSDGPAKS